MFPAEFLPHFPARLHEPDLLLLRDRLRVLPDGRLHAPEPALLRRREGEQQPDEQRRERVCGAGTCGQLRWAGRGEGALR